MFEESRGGGLANVRRIEGGGSCECSWKTPPHHWHLWINLAAAGDQDTVTSPRSDFQRCGYRESNPERKGRCRAAERLEWGD